MDQIIPGAVMLSLRQQNLSLLPQRAVFWHEEKTLIVADVHLGKAQTFQRAGMAVPGQSFTHDLARLEDLATRTSAQRLFVLGDFVHHHTGLTNSVKTQIARWCAQMPVEIHVILGNHDVANKKFIADLPLKIDEKLRRLGPFAFAHDVLGKDDSFLFSGHLHPVVNFKNHGLRLPAFVFYQHYCVLPAFSYFTGGWKVDINQVQRVFVTVDDAAVLPWPATGDPSAAGP